MLGFLAYLAGGGQESMGKGAALVAISNFLHRNPDLQPATTTTPAVHCSLLVLVFTCSLIGLQSISLYLSDNSPPCLTPSSTCIAYSDLHAGNFTRLSSGAEQDIDRSF